MKQWRSWLAVVVLAAVAFILIRICLRAYGLDSLFREQIPVHTPGRSFVVLAVVAPFGAVLLASLFGSAVARSSTTIAYAGSWLVYFTLLSQALLAMSGAFLLLLPLMMPVERLTYRLGLHPAHRGYLPIHYGPAHEPVVASLIAVGFALVVVGLVEVLRARKRNILATQGLYAVLRHPQHLGIIFWTLGFALWGSSVVDLILWFIVSYVFVCLGIHEEGKLVAQFGDEYLQYQSRVRFMSPFFPFRGALLKNGEDKRGYGIMAAVFVAGIVVLMLLFHVVGVPR